MVREFHAEKVRRQKEEALQKRRRFIRRLPELVAGILELDPDVELIVLFGSLARNESKIVRDIDIALRSRRFFKAAAWLLRQDEDIDVVDLDTLYPHIKERIAKEGRILYEKK